MDRLVSAPRSRRAFFLPGAALLLLLTPALAGQEASPPPAPPPALPALPAGIEPVSGELGDRVHGLLEKAETLRGLKALRPISAGTVDEAGLRAQMASSLRRQTDPARVRALELGLKAFGLIPESMSLARFLVELMTEEVAGYYDTDGKFLVLVRRPPAAAAKDEKSEEEMVLVHELVHALQDQHFDLHRFETVDPASDESTALEALVEGDATAAMLQGEMEIDPAFLPGIAVKLGKMMEDPSLSRKMGELPGGKVLDAAPAFLRESLLFSYLQGFLFVFAARNAGGQVLLDHAFATDPPRSTEQILHPEKWHGDRDDPVEIRLPDLAAEVPGLAAWAAGAERAEGEMGELGVRLLLRERLGDRERADRAAAGWSGDRYLVLAQGGDRRLVWLLDWDTEGDAAEFQREADRLGWGWRAERIAPNRVAVLRGRWERKDRAEVLARLARVVAGQPANRRIDLAAIGARPASADQAVPEDQDGAEGAPPPVSPRP